MTENFRHLKKKRYVFLFLFSYKKLHKNLKSYTQNKTLSNCLSNEANTPALCGHTHMNTHSLTHREQTLVEKYSQTSNDKATIESTEVVQN